MMDGECVMSNPEQLSSLYKSIRQQIKYYFSDYFLNQSKAVRRSFEVDQGFTVDKLLEFKRLASIVGADKAIVLAFLEENPKFDSVEYQPENKFLRRNTAFVRDKKYHLNNAHKILYLSQLPDGTNMDDIEKALQGFKYTAIETKKYHKEKKIFSCLIELDDSSNANKFYKFVNSENFIIGSNLSEQRVKVSKYRSYYTNHQKYHRANKRAKQIELSLYKLSLNSSGESTANSMEVDGEFPTEKKNVPLPFGFRLLVRRRTVIFNNTQSINYQTIRSVLTTLGAIYFYRMGTDLSKYYVLFQNKEAMKKFYTDLGGEYLDDVVLIEQDEVKPVKLQVNDFALIENEQDLPEFEAYVRCAKRFFRGKK